MNSDLQSYRIPMVADASVAERSEFIRKTYWHLAAAIAAFVALEGLFLKMGLGAKALDLLGTSQYSWLVVLGGFMVVSWVAEKWARSDTSIGMQYAGLALYTVAEALIFLPLIMLAMVMTNDGSLVLQAGLITIGMLVGITAVAFTTKKDFSFLGGFLKIGAFVAMGLIVCSFFLPISLGMWFSAAMVIFASVCILYNTSNIIHHYQPGQYVAASLSLFASVALLFWYVLRLLMSLRD